MLFSVLDLAPVASGSNAAVALGNSLDLARHVERLGYHRYWVAEHHNMPGIASSAPAVWLLGSSDYSAQVAAYFGLPFAFAHHFSPDNTLPALAMYRQTFRPSKVLNEPYALVAAAVVCADTDERARWLALPGALSFVRLRAGYPELLPSPECAAAYPYTDAERQAIQTRQAHQIVGDPGTGKRGLAD